VKVVRLGEVCKVISGSTPKREIAEYWGGSIPWVTPKEISRLTSRYLSDAAEKITEAGFRSCSTAMLPAGSLLLSSRAPIGLLAINKIPVCTNQGFKSLIPGAEVSVEYLYYVLKANVNALQARGNGATFKELAKPAVENFEIPLPPLNDQVRIAHLLGKVEGLIAQRKQQLQQVEELLKSVFLEMFGDIRAQKSSHPWEALRPYLKASSGKSSKKIIADDETGIPIFGGNGINGWAVEALYDDPVVIAGRVGQQCGVIHVSMGPCWVTDNAIALSVVNNEKLNIIYLAKAFHYAPIRDRVKQLDLPFINQSMLLDYPLPLPPIELQEHFAAIVQKVERVKASYQKSVTDLEALYGALSQQAFKGELDLSRVPLPGTEPEQEKILAAEALHAPAEQGLAINLPDTENLLDALESDEAREALVSHWLEAYRGQLGSTSFSVQRFMAAAQTRLAELHPDNDFTLGANDYEHIREWVFEALAAGTLTQAFDDADNRIELKAVQP
jgi:type I restriction enzyme S subunit